MLQAKNTRKKQICDFLNQHFQTSTQLNEQNLLAYGRHAEQIADQLGLDRANVSRELNQLLKEELVLKVNGKPVYYFSRKALESARRLVFTQCIFKNKPEFLQYCLKPERSPGYPPTIISGEALPRNKNKSTKKNFDIIIGSDGSLKNQIKQAIAAIIYPSNGLHTFLIGPTGVGKTTFAELMYHYALETGRLSPRAPYVIFNCADYAGNPHLLLSHLFGHVKGAFTGADREKKGLIDEADGGILFLDEVHRLPPEGQEMLFSLMDRGLFRRLGESGTLHQAKVFIISATTENPDKSVLNTFLRRIPCVIKMPGLAERPLKERMQLISAFFTEESKKIKLPVTVSTEVLKLFLLYDCKGNIGQLKNDVQLTCANAFVEYISGNQPQIYIKLSQMSDRFRESIFVLKQKREELLKNFDFPMAGELTFNAETSSEKNPLEKIVLHDDYRTEEDFYEKILNTSKRYFDEGKSLEEIKRNINRQVEGYFQKHPYSQANKFPDENQLILSKFVQKEIVGVVKEILTSVSSDLQITIDAKIIYGLTLHIETLLERLKSGNYRPRENYLAEADTAKEESLIAQKIKKILDQAFTMNIPKEEATFIAMFLQALRYNHNKNSIGILVMSHGDTTASSMANVANRLLDTDHVKAIDMPLTASVHDTLHKALDMVRKMQRYQKGVLLLIDMGSLASFAEIITKKTDIPVKTIKMVSTPMVIEAARKAMIPDITLHVLAEEVKSTSKFLGQNIVLDAPEQEAPPSKISTVEQSSAALGNIDWFDHDRKRMMDLLEEVLTFLNPDKAYNLLNQVYLSLLIQLRLPADQGLKVKFIFHNISMLERVISHETYGNAKMKELKRTQRRIFLIVKKEFQLIENAFGIKIPDAEFAYVVEILQIYL